MLLPRKRTEKNGGRVIEQKIYIYIYETIGELVEI